MLFWAFITSAVTAALIAASVALRRLRYKRAAAVQLVFIRETLAAAPPREQPRIVVSLTTLPDRIAQLRPTLHCLLAQTRPADEIIIAIPELSVRQRRPYVIPQFLHDLPSVRVLRADRDWGPATKSIPTVQHELAAGRRDTAIVVVDDDRIYPRDAIATYLHYEAELPDAALCFRGAAMPRSFDWRDAKMIHGNRLREPKRVAVITGCGSYLIKPRFFDDTFWDYTAAPRAAFYMDDIWISARLDGGAIRKYVVPSSDRLRSVAAQQRTMTLHDVPRGRQSNNNEVIAFFRDCWDVFPLA
ncbi:MAG: hypothetical protein ABR526_07330 [Chthoniobacterales bacterium]